MYYSPLIKRSKTLPATRSKKSLKKYWMSSVIPVQISVAAVEQIQRGPFIDTQKKEIFKQLKSILHPIFQNDGINGMNVLINLYLVITGARSGYWFTPIPNEPTSEQIKSIIDLANLYGLGSKMVKNSPLIADKKILETINLEDDYHTPLGKILGYPCEFSYPNQPRKQISLILQSKEEHYRITGFLCRNDEYNANTKTIEDMRQKFENDLKVINPTWKVLAIVKDFDSKF